MDSDTATGIAWITFSVIVYGTAVALLAHTVHRRTYVSAPILFLTLGILFPPILMYAFLLILLVDCNYVAQPAWIMVTEDTSVTRTVVRA